jgi:5-methyltetrahydropteroyltriglutamate--homocysteine methyltransferase
MRRSRFVYELFGRLEGLERLAPARRLGVPGYDRAPGYRAVGPIRAPAGMGIVAEYEELRALCPGRPVTIAFPGPLTFAGRIQTGSYGENGAAGERLLTDLVTIARDEIRALLDRGAQFVQLDEPGLPRPPYELSFEAGAEVINSVVAIAPDRCAVHVCFGNNASRPAVRRDLGRLYPSLGTLRCETLLLEFANREMADLEGLVELAQRYRIAAGVVDVKSFHEESAALVAERIARVLRFVPAERMWVTMDCGLSALPRWLARRKLHALVEGARLARAAL